MERGFIMNFFEKVMNIFSLKNSLPEAGIEGGLSDAMSAALAEWEMLYRDKEGLALASAVASETARLVTAEFESEVSGSSRAEFLNEQYKEVLSGIRNITERACASGGVILKPYVQDDKIKVSVIGAENFIPTEFDSSGNITGAAFLERCYVGKKVYTRIEKHGFENGLYIIENLAYVSDNAQTLGKRIEIREVDMWSDIEPEACARGVKRPLFSYFKMPMANCIDTSSPMGISVFARSGKLIRDADLQYKRLLWEFESGERALYVDEAAMRRDTSGNAVIPDKRLYRLLNSGDDALFADWSPEIRDESIINGLNEILRRIEFNSGLAYGTLSDVMNVDRTAEEIRVSKQRSYAHVCEIQDSLKTALGYLLEAMDAICDLYSLAPAGEYNASFGFDDSIVADKRAEFDERIALLNAGIISPYEIRMWYFGEDEKTAKERICQPAHIPQKNTAGGKV